VVSVVSALSVLKGLIWNAEFTETADTTEKIRDFGGISGVSIIGVPVPKQKKGCDSEKPHPLSLNHQ
jgi:hypothetical protein